MVGWDMASLIENDAARYSFSPHPVAVPRRINAEVKA
jgi:hypothetical protein